MYYKIEQLKNILTSNKNWKFSLDHLCSSALEYIQHLESGIDRCYELAKQLESAQPKWISVEERLPETDERVLFVDDGEVGFGIVRGWALREMISETDIHRITHWMPLPEPPKEDV